MLHCTKTCPTNQRRHNMFNFVDITKAKNFKEVVELIQTNVQNTQTQFREGVEKAVEFQKTYFDAIIQNNMKAFEQFSSFCK